MNETVKAYAAGAIDADGHIGIHKGSSTVGGKTYYYPKASTVLTSQDLELLTWFQEQFGGRIQKSNNVWMWWAGKDQEQFLVDIAPYLHTKKAQAVLVLEFLRLPRRHGVALTQEQIDERQSFVDRSKELNNRFREARSELKRQQELEGK